MCRVRTMLPFTHGTRHTYMHTCIHACVCVCVCTHTHTNKHTHPNTHTPLYIYEQATYANSQTVELLATYNGHIQGPHTHTHTHTRAGDARKFAGSGTPGHIQGPHFRRRGRGLAGILKSQRPSMFTFLVHKWDTLEW